MGSQDCVCMRKENTKRQKKKVLRVFEAFAGYGGASFGLKMAHVPHRIIGYSEIHPNSIELYEKNHEKIKNFGDITKLDPSDIPNFDLFTGGFPCQAFSSAGKGLGELDIRGTLFYEIIRICSQKQPTHILLENVKGLITQRHHSTFQKILSELRRLGYNVVWELLNSKEFGIPQNRERVWIFATKKNIPSDWSLSPDPEPLKLHFKDLLEKSPDPKYFKNEKQVKRLIEVTNVSLDVKEPSCFDVYNRKVRTDQISITLTEPHHNNLRVVEPRSNGVVTVRKMTEREHFRFMGFTKDEIKIDGMSYSQLCRCAGNGWDVNMASKIFKQIAKLL